MVGMFFSFGYVGYTMAFSNEETLTKFINFASVKDISLSSLNAIFLRISGVISLLSALCLAYGITKSIFVLENGKKYLLWGILLGLFSLMFYGLPVRLASNHAFSFNIFAYLVLLFWLFRYIKNSVSDVYLETFQYLPIYGLLFFTMGQPGYRKLFNAEYIMGNFKEQFADTILSQMPGGVPPFVYFLGVCQFIVPFILLVSLLKKEYLPNSNKLWLKISIVATLAVFFMLSLGQILTLTYIDVTKLFIYSVLTIVIYVEVEKDSILNKV